MGITHPDLPLDSSPCVCTLPVVETPVPRSYPGVCVVSLCYISDARYYGRAIQREGVALYFVASSQEKLDLSSNDFEEVCSRHPTNISTYALDRKQILPIGMLIVAHLRCSAGQKTSSQKVAIPIVRLLCCIWHGTTYFR